VDVFGEVSTDYEKPDIYHVFYPNNDDSLTDATLDLNSGDIVYLREEYGLEKHKDFLESVEDKLEEHGEMENSYDFVGQVNDYAGN